MHKEKQSQQVASPKNSIGRIFIGLLIICMALFIAISGIVLIESRHIIPVPIQTIALLIASVLLLAALALMLMMPRLMYRIFPRRSKRKEALRKPKD